MDDEGPEGSWTPPQQKHSGKEIVAAWGEDEGQGEGSRGIDQIGKGGGICQSECFILVCQSVCTSVSVSALQATRQ